MVSRLLSSPRDFIFGLGVALIVVQTLANPRDTVAGAVVLVFWLVLWAFWYDKDTGHRLRGRLESMPAWLTVTAAIPLVWILARIARDDQTAGTMTTSYIAGLIYFLPVVVARSRGRLRVAPVILTNLFFGWTVIGWVIALILSLIHI